MSPEKKQSDQTHDFLLVEFKQAGNNNGYSLGIARSFSPEGFSFDSQNYDLGQGEILECTLKHPKNNLSVTVRGVIVWKEESWYKCMTGLKFMEGEQGDTGKIRELISATSGAGTGDITFERERGGSAGEIKVAHARTDDIKTLTPRYTEIRPDNDSTIYDEATASAPRQKSIMSMVAVIAVSAVILAGILFFIPHTSKKNIDAPAPSSQPSANSAPATVTGNSRSENLSARQPKAEQITIKPAQENQKENKETHPAQPVAKPDKQSIASIPVEKTASIKPDLLPPAVNKPEEAGTDLPQVIKETAPVPVTDNQAISKEPVVAPNDMSNHIAVNKPSVPVGEPPVVKQDIFDHNFRQWETFNTSMASAKMEHGEYHIQNKRKTGAHIILNNSDVPSDSDFTFEAPVRLVESSGNNSYGVVFGAKDAQNNLTFQINAADSYSIRQYRNGSVREVTGGKIKSPVLIKDYANKLKVVKQGRKIRFYINDAYVDEISILSLAGSKTGFIVDGESEIALKGAPIHKRP